MDFRVVGGLKLTLRLRAGAVVQVKHPLCSPTLSIIWLVVYLCLFIFVSRFMSMAYFALPPQSVPIRIVNPAAAAATSTSATSAASAAARVASPDGHSPHPAVSPHPDRPDRLDRPGTPKAVIGSVLSISPSIRQAQSYHRLVPAIMS